MYIYFQEKTKARWFIVNRLRTLLEAGSEHEADAPSLSAGLQIVDAMHILDVQQLEYVVYSGYQFDVGATRRHKLRVVRETAIRGKVTGETEQRAVLCILAQERIVLVGQVSEVHITTKVLSPLQFLEQWDAIKYLAVEVPTHQDGGVAVGDELHVVDEIEGIVLHYIAEVGNGEAQQWEGHLVPLALCLHIEIELAPGVQPETLVDGKLGEVVVVLSTHNSLETDRVSNAPDGRVEVGLESALLGVYPRGSWLVLESDAKIGCGEIPVVKQRVLERTRHTVQVGSATAKRLEEEFAGSLCPLASKGRNKVHAVLPLAVVLQLEALHVAHMVETCPLERVEDVIFICLYETVARCYDIIEVMGCDVVLGELSRKIILGVYGIGDLCQALPALVTKSVAEIALSKPMLVEVCRGLCTGTQLESLDKVVGKGGVHRTNVYLGWSLGVYTCLDEILDKCLCNPQYVLESLDALYAAHKEIHLALALRERRGALFLPELGVAHSGRTLDLGIAAELERAVGNLGEVEIAVLDGALDLSLLYPRGKFELDDGLTVCYYLLACRQRFEVLDDIHVLDKIDIRTVGDAQMNLLESIRTVCQHPQLARKAEVLWIVGGELHLETLLVVNHRGVGQVVSVELDGVGGGNGTGEGILKETHIVLVDVNVGKTVREHGRDDVAGADKLVDALIALTDNNGLLGLGILAENDTAHLLLNNQGKDELAGLQTGLDVVLKEWEVLEVVVLEYLWSELVQCRGHLLVLHITEVVVMMKVARLLCLDDFLHQQYCRIVLPYVFLLLCYYLNLLQRT